MGGGVRGASLFRDLAFQGVDVLLIDESDFCSGASALPRIIPSGIRFLENGKVSLAREAALERDRMIQNAPHLVRPLPVVLPIFKSFAGLLDAPLRFLNLSNRPSEHGALVTKIGLMLYGFLTRKQGVVPQVKFDERRRSLAKYPKLSNRIKHTATFYAGQILSPERLTIELILDGEGEGTHAKALNYVLFENAQGDQVALRDKLTGNTFEISPKHIVNFTHYDIGTDLYLVLDYPALYEILGKDGFFVESKDGHPLLIFPFYDKVMIKMYTVRQMPEDIQEVIDLILSIFPTIKPAPEQIVFHSLSKFWLESGNVSAQDANKALSALGKTRKVDTRKIQIGGGKDYPVVGIAKIEFIKKVADELASRATIGKTVQFHPKKLFERYGTRALEVAHYIKGAKDEPLKSNPDWSRREIEFLVEREKAVHVDDIMLRRSTLAWLGQIDKPLIEELTEVMGESLGWSADQKKSELQRTLKLLKDLHGM